MGAAVIEELPGSASFDGTEWTNDITRSFIVSVSPNEDGSIPYDAPFQAITATGLPGVYDSYSDAIPYCIALNATSSPLSGTKNCWKVDVAYSSRAISDGNTGVMSDGTDFGDPEGPQQFSADTPPDQRPIQVEPFSRQIEEYPGPVDLEGTPVVNAADSLILDIRIPNTVHGFRLKFKTNRTLGAQFEKKVFYTNKVNADTFFGFPAFTLRCTDYDVKPVWEHQAYYMDCTIEFEISLEEWVPYVTLNQGTTQIKDGKRQPCVDTSGNPLSEPVPLSVTGLQLEAGSALNFLEFNFYETVAFAGIA